MLSEAQIQSIREAIVMKDDSLSLLFNALGDKTRFRIFKILMDHKEICVTELSVILGVSTSAVSQHLKHFEQLDMIKPERHGQMICYQINKQNSIVKSFVKILQKK